jgi:dihydroorotate dehydrogenase (fumarate)
MATVDLTTTYMGLTLKNPLIVGSSSLTGSLKRIEECAAAGAGALVLKSLFEEQISAGVAAQIEEFEPTFWHVEAAEYISKYGQENALSNYLRMIQEAKQATSVPIIASINCVSEKDWPQYASRIESAGADALELNVFVLPVDPHKPGVEYEGVYFDILRRVKKHVSIPVAVKIGSYFTNPAAFCSRMANTGADALVLFNRFYQPSFDIEQLKVVPAPYFSSPEEFAHSLRWIAILSGEITCQLAAATGIHDGPAAIRQLLAGADAVQVCSALYKHGPEHLQSILAEITAWMDRHGYTSLQDFRGKLSQERSDSPGVYERVQFMKFSVGVE